MIAKINLSAGADGCGIKVAATSSPGTLIHTAAASGVDEVWLWLYNHDTVARDVTLEWGGTTSPDNVVQQTVPAKTGLFLAAPGLVLANSKVVRCFASAANVVVVYGFANRLT